MLTPDDLPRWQEAQERVLLYLKKLGIPALLSLEVAHQALANAAEEAPAAEGRASVTQSAMRALHRILVEKPELLDSTPHRKYRILFRRWQADDSAEPFSCEVPGPDSGLQSGVLPPIDRGSMNIRKL